MKYDQLFQYYTENPSSTFTTIHNSNNRSVYRSSENSSIDSNHTQFDVYKHNMHNKKQHSDIDSRANFQSNLSHSKSNQHNKNTSEQSNNSFNSNFPMPFPNSSSTCNSSAQLSGSQYGNNHHHQQHLPTSTPRFSSYENCNKQLQHQSKLIHRKLNFKIS